MFDERSTQALLGPADPARDVVIPSPRTTAAGLIATADAMPAKPERPNRNRRRLVLAAAAVAVTAAATGTVYVATQPDAAPHGQADQATPRTTQPAGPRLGPVVRPAALQYTNNPPAAREQLRALASRVSRAPYDSASGRYTYIHTIGWNAVFDASPGGDAQVIRPQDKQIWYAADASGRIKVIPLPAVYPNEQSRQYWEQHPDPTKTPAAQTNDLPAGRAGPRAPLPSDHAGLAAHLGVDTAAQHGTASVFFAVRDVYTFYLVPQQTRVQILRILADLPGVSWRGNVTDRAGRAGVAISLDTTSAQELLIFDPSTGALLAWDEVERPADTVAGATLILGTDRTDHLG